MTSSDLETRDARVQIFQADLDPSLRSHRLTQNDQNRKDNEDERGAYFQGVSHTPIAMGRGPNARQFGGLPSIYAYTLWRRRPNV